MAGSCERGNESSGSIKCWEILEQLSDCVGFSRRTQLHGVSSLVYRPRFRTILTRNIVSRTALTDWSLKM
jgi:hypothetical protein